MDWMRSGLPTKEFPALAQALKMGLVTVPDPSGERQAAEARLARPDHLAANIATTFGQGPEAMVVGRRAIEEWPVTPGSFQFHASIPGDVDEGFGSGQYREQP